MVIRLVAAIVVWVLAALLLGFIGGLLGTVDQTQINAVGDFLKDNAGLLGFLAGAWFFLWGTVPKLPQR